MGLEVMVGKCNIVFCQRSAQFRIISVSRDVFNYSFISAYV